MIGGFIKTLHTQEHPGVSAQLEEEVNNAPLQVTGTIPTWLSGTLVRNGPITVNINGKSNTHWFDGLAMLHGFAFHEGRVTYTNKFLRSDAYRTVFQERSLDYEGFAKDPCRSLFKRFFTFFFPSSHVPIHNANVNVMKLADAYVALTEVPLPVQFDLQTLETLGVLNYQDQLPKEKCWESAHPHHDSKDQSTLNYLIKFGRHSTYMLYTLENGSAHRTILAEIPVDYPAYMHSFAITENYIVFTEFPFIVDPLDLIMNKKAFIKHFTWQPKRGTRFTIIDRHTGKLVGQYVTRPFFAFHHANAFERNDFLYMDLVTYEDSSIITGERFQMSTDEMKASPHPTPQLERFSLALGTDIITSEPLLQKPCEFPRINDAFDGRPYRYLYLTGFNTHPADKEDLLEGNSLYKVDTMTKEVLTWSERACSIGEPVFVATPTSKKSSQEEDDGIVLAVILDRVHFDSFLLILDAKNLQEVARAKAPHLIPAGLHGQYFPMPS